MNGFTPGFTSRALFSQWKPKVATTKRARLIQRTRFVLASTPISAKTTAASAISALQDWIAGLQMSGK